MIKLKEQKLVAVIHAESLDEALLKAEGCIAGGIKIIEFTFSFADCCKAIKETKARYDIIAGAGTVLNTDDAMSAIDNGSDFIVSPHTDKDIIDLCRNNNKIVICGASTSNEIVNAWKLGTSMVKIFPADIVGGPRYIKAIKEPLPFAEIFVTGGINLDNCLDYFTHGASLIGIASALFTEPVNSGTVKLIEGNARKFVEKLQMI